MRARLLERTRRFAYLMLRHQCHFLNMPVHTMNSSSPTWGSLLEVVLMAKIKEAKASRRAKVRGKARRKGRASKAKVHREVPITIDYGAERMEPGLPVHLVLEAAAWVFLALGLSP